MLDIRLNEVNSIQRMLDIRLNEVNSIQRMLDIYGHKMGD
jgi:hypothetical protein